MAQGEWYYCLRHRMVEPYEACRNESRLGPYTTAADAADALHRVAQRNDVWENDPRYSDDEDDDDKDKEAGLFGN